MNFSKTMDIFLSKLLRMKFLNLGCGSHYHDSWTNVDFKSTNENVIAYNLLNGVPFQDNSFNVVYHSHVLEHFSKKDGFRFMQDCYRVLDKNGIIRIAVPNLEQIVKEYIKNLGRAIEGDTHAKYNYEWIKLELLDQMVRNESGGEMKSYLFQPELPNETYVYNRIGHEGKLIREAFLSQATKDKGETKERNNDLIPIFKRISIKVGKFIKGKDKKNTFTTKQVNELKIGEFRLGGEIHQWMYDRYSLGELLKDLGFEDVKVCSAYESNIENWNSYQLDVVNGEIRKPDSLFMEAIKK